jgi:hypothetical protein
VINTDRTWSEYRMHTLQIFLHKEEVTSSRIHINKTTHTLSQCSNLQQHQTNCCRKCLSALVPFCENVKILSKKYGNVYCHQIIKAAKETQTLYLNDIVNLYMNKSKFILILNCWEGQPNPTWYNEEFLDLKKMSSAPQWKQYCQNVQHYDIRISLLWQIKNDTAKFQNCLYSEHLIMNCLK